MSKRKLEENDVDQESKRQRQIRPFTRKSVDFTERQQQKTAALAAITRFLKISDKFGKACQKVIDKADQLQSAMAIKYFTGILHDYQETGVKWMESLFLNGINGILADEMGLGKTVQVIALLSKLQEQGVNGMHLITVPLSTAPNWISEFERFAPSFPVFTYYGDANARHEIQTKITNAQKKGNDKTKIYPIVLVPHHFIPLDIQFFKKIKFVYLVIDEGHNIKNYQTQISKAVRLIPCMNKLLLTGTPVQNNMLELWSLLNFIMPKVFTNLETFDWLIQTDDLANETFMVSNIEESTTIMQMLQRILQPFMLRRMKCDVLKDNIPKKEVLLYCEMTQTQKSLYVNALGRDIERMKGDLTEKTEDVEFLERSARPGRNKTYGENVVKKIQRTTIEPNPMDVTHRIKFQNPLMLYRHIANHPYLVSTPLIPGTPYILVDERLVTESSKFKLLDTLLAKLIAGGHKVLIFSTFIMMLDLIEDYVQMREIKYRRLDGNKSFDQRAAAIDRFNNDPEVSIFLISTRAGGLGLNLVAADTVIFYDRDFNPHADLQALSRCHRIGQVRPVMVYTLITKNTVDEYILQLGEVKLRLEKIVMADSFKLSKKEAADVLEARQELLEILQKKETVTVHPNGLTYSDQELDVLLDRSELIKEMEDKKRNILGEINENIVKQKQI